MIYDEPSLMQVMGSLVVTENVTAELKEPLVAGERKGVYHQQASTTIVQSQTNFSLCVLFIQLDRLP